MLLVLVLLVLLGQVLLVLLVLSIGAASAIGAECIAGALAAGVGQNPWPQN